MSDSVNLRALPGSLIATLPDGSEKHSFAGDWGSLKWKVRGWASNNKVSVKKSDYDKVRDAFRDAAAKTMLKRPVKVTIPTRGGDAIIFTYTPEPGSKRKDGNKPTRPVKKQPTKKQPVKVSERAARRTVRAA